MICDVRVFPFSSFISRALLRRFILYGPYIFYSTVFGPTISVMIPKWMKFYSHTKNIMLSYRYWYSCFIHRSVSAVKLISYYSTHNGTKYKSLRQKKWCFHFICIGRYRTVLVAYITGYFLEEKSFLPCRYRRLLYYETDFCCCINSENIKI